FQWRAPTTAYRKALLATLAMFALLNVSYFYINYEVRVAGLSLPWSLFKQPAPNASHSSEAVPSPTTELPTESPDPSWKSDQFRAPIDQLSSGYDRLPYPVENTSYLPIAPSVLSACRSNLGYLFFVHTAPGHFSHRNILRRFIGNATMMSEYNWSIVFFLGLSHDAKTMNSVLEEAAHNRDIVVFPYMDAYRNLTYKFVYGIKWTMDNCPSAKYIVKMDDDIVINLYKLLGYLDQRTESEPPAFHCCVWDGMPVIRHPKSPWYLSKKVYPNNVFPRYCSGSAVIFRSSILRPLYNASFRVPFFSVDDALVTGEMAKLAGVGHVSLNKYYSFSGNEWKKVVKGTIIFGHIREEKARVNAWKAVVKELVAKRKLVPETSNSAFDSKSVRTSDLGVSSTSGAVMVRTESSSVTTAANRVSSADNHTANDANGDREAYSSTYNVTYMREIHAINSTALPMR
ncbi:unnamed protein product, partial [Ixodes hexagonus]